MNRPDWFNGQGFNLTECAPTIAANLVNYLGGNTNRFEARAFNRHGVNVFGFWNMQTIIEFMMYKGYTASRVTPVRAPKDGEIMVYHVNGFHFVCLENKLGELIQYDTKWRGSVRVVRWSQFFKRISLNACILVV